MRRTIGSRNEYNGGQPEPTGEPGGEEGKPSRPRKSKRVGAITLKMAQKSVKSLKILLLVVAGLYLATAAINMFLLSSQAAVSEVRNEIRQEIEGPEYMGEGEEESEKAVEVEAEEEEAEYEESGQAAVEEGKTREQEGEVYEGIAVALIWIFIAVHVALAMVYIGLFFLAGKNPLAAAVAALAIFGAVVATFGFLNPETLMHGLFIKIIIIVSLAGGISASLKYNRAIKRIEREREEEQGEAAG